MSRNSLKAGQEHNGKGAWDKRVVQRNNEWHETWNSEIVYDWGVMGKEVKKVGNSWIFKEAYINLSLTLEVVA